jgi:hypothetical protein
LLDRLENDRSLAGFAGQFVPLKIVTDGNPQWGKWSRLYPMDGGGIPRLYVVRADGEKLYAAVGSLPGDQLPQMLLATLKQSGRAFNAAEALLLEKAVRDAEAALQKDDLLAASLALASSAELGAPDELRSYATTAIRAGQLYEELQSKIDSQVTQMQGRLSGSGEEDPLDAILSLCEAEACYELFPKLKAKAGTVTRDLNKQSRYEEPLAQAEGLMRARSLRGSSNPRVRRRASAAYTAVIRRFPGSRVDELARAELASLDPAAAILQATDQEAMSTAVPAFRQWTARQGNFTTRAKFVQQQGGKVQLIKDDGTKIVVDISVLSDEDQTYLRQQVQTRP